MAFVPSRGLQSQLRIQQSVQSPGLLALRALEWGRLVRLDVMAAAEATPLGQVRRAAEQDPVEALVWRGAVTVEPAATTPVLVRTVAAAVGEPRAVAAAAVAPLVAALVPETAQAVLLDLVVQQVLEAQTRLRVQVHSGLDSLELVVHRALLVAVAVVAVAAVRQAPRVAVVVLAVVAVALEPDRRERAAPVVVPSGSMHTTPR